MSAPQETIPEEAPPEMRATLAASVVLMTLPGDAATALAKYATPAPTKVGIKFRPIGSAPKMSRPMAKISASQPFGAVVRFLRRQLRVQDDLFVYVNSSFAPALDEEVGYLHSCYSVDGYLQVSYCTTAAFG
ncbi:ubiquitin-like autophagy protein Apg12-domain-containing protein [Limtongia smithiae]|uniref:ubiquitin-like autophagy protein Apg12-domain-containing protein n=1 Tax=Limtongia smithiae TaxID=1125753 RepID=UPI0034CF52CF